IGIPGVIGQYDARLSRELLEGGEVLVLAGGTGNPFFTTDTAAVLRAKELGADAVFKATKVDYVYDRDPLKDGSAKAFRTLTFKEVINRGLMVMDLTAITLAMELRLPICVFNFSRPGNLIKAANGEEIGTFIWEV
ncbi:MAG: UMP kinase, partial [Desulfatiglandales bacterium]